MTGDSAQAQAQEITPTEIVPPLAISANEIDIAITTARRFPRSLAIFKEKVESMATLDQETAEGCFYSLRRPGKTIQGPSVRLAEIAVCAWGNIRTGARIVGETQDGKFITAQGVCHDLENNVHVSMEVQRRITDKDGRRYGDDMIGVTANAAAAIAFRNAVFKVVPKLFLKSAYEKAKTVATGDAKTLTERREAVFARLRQLNPQITEERILAAIERPDLESVTLQDVTHLIGLGTAIKDGDVSIDEAFPEPAVRVDDVLGTAKEGAPE